MARDREKEKEQKRRYRERKKIEKYGPEAASKDMRGRHGNHASGTRNGRWNKGRLISSQGYAMVRVGNDHPIAFGNGYAYEHDLVAIAALGRPLRPDETVHHRNGDRADNRWGNLEVMTRSDHAREHNPQRKRDALGRYASDPEDLRVRELPGG